MNNEQLKAYSAQQEARADIVKRRDNELYWGNLSVASALTKQLKDLPYGNRSIRRKAARAVKRLVCPGTLEGLSVVQ